MAGVPDPASKYFKDGCWAWDPAAEKWLKLLIDPLTNRLVVDHPGKIVVEQTTPASLTPGIYGWDGAIWRKLPLVFGYSDRWREDDSGAAVGAGNATAQTAGVAEGYVYMLQAAAVYHDAGAAKRVILQLVGGGGVCAILDVAAADSGEMQTWSGSVILKEDDALRAIAYSPGDGKTVGLYVWGYKMKVAE